MTKQIAQYPPRPDTSHLITEDDRPVDNRFSERQMRMLPHILHSSWHEGKPFEALADVGLFPSVKNEDVVVPDFLLSLGVTPRPVTGAVEDRSYLMWVYGKAPDLVIEIVSNKEGGELTTKLDKYARIRVTYYAVYDPFHCLSKSDLKLYHLVDGRYVSMTPSSFMSDVGLGLTIWKGSFEGVDSLWLRFLDSEGNLIPTPDEKSEADAARSEADAARSEAEAARQEAAVAKQDAAREIAHKMHSQGLDIETI
ncbi:unnamed protein product, partial [Phaeothamnion confervicola]